jgi:hypothetical protein
MDGKIRNRFQGIQINALPSRLIWIYSPGNHGRKISYPHDSVLFSQNSREKLVEIQPFVWGAFYCTVIQVETIHINNRAQIYHLKKAKATRFPSRPLNRQHAADGYSVKNIRRNSSAVKYFFQGRPVVMPFAPL